MTSRRRRLAAFAVTGAASLALAGAALPAVAQSSSLPTTSRLSPSQARFTEQGGAPAMSTPNTVQSFHGSFTDPTNGVTYGYNMVGVDPATNGSATIHPVVVPLDLTFPAQGGYTVPATPAAQALASSPIWSTGTYTQTGDQNVQYEDAVMRAQFNKVGSSYHLQLAAPTFLPPVTLSVPNGQGQALQIPNGPVLEFLNSDWFNGRINSLNNTLGLDPTQPVIYITDDAILYVNNNTNNCCVLGYHGASEVNGHGTGSTHGNGNQVVQTYIWASYLRPGVFSTTDSPADESGGHYLQDMHGLSHEISEWGDDPFVNNKVNPWLTPTAPQYGCTKVLETGDPVVGIGFHQGHNTFAQDTANGADGFWHPEDEVLLPWFARQSPSSAYGGYYTFMGPANPFPGFHQPATGC